MRREHIWVFFVLAAISVALVIYHLFSWKKLASDENYGTETSAAPKTLLERAKAFKANFDINGKWFLIKLYGSEVLESCTQMYNTATIYSCTLPPGVVLFVCFLLVCDHGFRLRNMWKPNTTHTRDLQVTLDLIMDLVCMILPITFLWFGYFVPLSVGEVLSLVGYPTLSTAMKLDDLMEENVRSQRNNVEISRQRSVSFTMGRERHEMFRKTILEENAESQEAVLRNSFKKGISVLIGLPALYFLVTGITVVSLSPSCNDNLWDKCLIKVPLCQFDISCNCAILRVEKHNMTVLPAEIQFMTAMRDMAIKHGPLKELPELGNFMPFLATLNVDFNKLTRLPASMSKMHRLVQVYASFNRLSSLPEALRTHASITYLDLSTNNITKLPQTIDIQKIKVISFANNSIEELPTSLFNHQDLTVLILDGNHLAYLPDEVGHLEALDYLSVSRNNLTTFPQSFSKLKLLNVLDARNNSLHLLPQWNELEFLNHLTVAGNPLCTNGWVGAGKVKNLMAKEGEGCSLQCSAMCLDINRLDYGCNYECNVPNCQYDNGKCLL
eukprot:g7229.t1